MTKGPVTLSRGQQVTLVVLRTLVGWHFLYEGFVKLWAPAWSRAGLPLAPFSSAAYLKGASGPLAGLFQGLAVSPALPFIDRAVVIMLVLVGLSLLLGLFCRVGAFGALALLILFYLPAIPTAGVHQPGTEGAYLIVNKNLIEAAAVAVILIFRTERIAGLDLLRKRPASIASVPTAEGAA
jgi:thiosulfate dehydrogenase [quinone] large subunit